MANKANKKNEATALDLNETLSRSEAFVTKYKKQLIIGCVALVVVVGGFLGFKYGYLQPQEEKAQTLFTQGLTYIAQQDYDKALKGEGKFPGYIKLANSYKLTDASNLANIEAGFCYYQKGDYKNAIKYYEAFSPKGDKTVSAGALAALANYYAASKQVDKAIETFRKAADKADNESMSPAFLLEAGKLLESQKKNDEALKVYTEIKEKYPNSTLSARQPAQNGLMMDAEIDRYIQRVSK
ncbi:MAG: tetratricopeptide repeat protein [Bacteroidaceae bacterium]|nr:tetratricopeptide repeat protein [Bacteroidaceae bacterium]